MEPIDNRNAALEALRKERERREREVYANTFSPMNNMILGGVGQAAGTALSGAGFALRNVPFVGRKMREMGSDLSNWSREAFPMTDQARRGQVGVQQAIEDLEKQESWMTRPAPEGASAAQRVARDVVQSVAKNATAIGQVMSGDPEGAVAYLTDTTVRNAPNTAVALGAYAVGGPAAGFAASMGLETGALTQELDEYLTTSGTDATFRQEMAVLLGGGSAAALDVVGAEGVMSAARRVSTAGKVTKPSRFLKSVESRLRPFMQSGRELPTEFAQEIIANAAEKHGWNPEQDYAEGAFEAMFAAGPTAIAGGITGQDGKLSQKVADPVVEEKMINADPEQLEQALAEGVREEQSDILPQPQQPWTEEEARSLDKHIRDGGYVTLEEAARHPRTLKAFLAGSPPQVTDVPTQRRLEDRVTELADFGVNGRYWYENSGNVLLGLARNDEDARKIAQLIAITSPQNPVPENWDDAMQIWSEYQESLRTGKRAKFTGGKNGWQNRAAEQLLYDGKEWSGLKTNSFYSNITAVLDNAPGTEVTVDIWVMRGLGYPTEAPTSAQYRYGKRTLNDVAERMGWTGWQVQAAMWEATKHLKEKKGVTDLLGVDLSQYDPTEVQSVDYSTVAGWRQAQVSVEVIPGRSTGVMPGIHEADLPARQEYTDAMWRALHDKDGRNILYDAFGLLGQDNANVLAGYWQGDVNPVMQLQLQMVKMQGSSESQGVRVTPTLHVPGLRGADKDIAFGAFNDAPGIQRAFKAYLEEGTSGNAAADEVFQRKVEKQSTFKVQPEQERAVRAFAAALGRLFKQEGVGYHRPVFNADEKQMDGMAFDFGRTVSPAEMDLIAKRIDQDHGAGASDSFGLISTSTGVRVINFGGMENNAEFLSYIEAVVGDTISEDMTSMGFASYGDLITNDWEANPDGQGYQNEAGPESSDVQRRVFGTVARQIAETNRAFADRYGWDDPSRFDADAQAAAAIEYGSQGLEERASPIQTVSGAEGTFQPARDQGELQAWQRDLQSGVEALASGARPAGGDIVGTRRPPKGKVLARAMATQLKRYKTSAIVGQKVTDARDLADLMQIYRDPRWETLRVVYTKGGEIVHHEATSIRMPSAVASFPREMGSKSALEHVKSGMLRTGADRVYVVHNHPSGNAEPSVPDIRYTQALAQELGARAFGGHVVIDSGKASVIFGKTDQGQDYRMFDVERFDYGAADVPHPVLGTVVETYEDLNHVAHRMRQSGAQVGQGEVMLLAVDGAGRIAGVTQVSQADLLGTRGPALARATMRSMGSARLIAVGVGEFDSQVHDMIRGGFLYEALDANGVGYRETRMGDEGQRVRPEEISSLESRMTGLGGVPVAEGQEGFGGDRARPDLGLPGTPEGQKALNEADRIRNMRGEPDTQTVEEWDAEADQRLESNYQGEVDRVFNTPDGMSRPADVRAAQKIISREAGAALRTNDKGAWQSAIMLGIKYRQAGTDAARMLRARATTMGDRAIHAVTQAVTAPSKTAQKQIDRVLDEKSPAQRAVNKEENAVRAAKATLERRQNKLRDLEMQAQAIATRNEANAVKADIDALNERIRSQRKDVQNAKARLETRNKQLSAAKARQQELLDKIVAREAEVAAEMNVKLKDLGINVDELTLADLSDRDAARILREVQGIKADGWDVLYEYWINALLSAPITHARNVGGNAFNAAWDISVQRGMETMLAAGLRVTGKPEAGPYASEAKYIYGALFSPGRWKAAFRKGAMAFDSEQSLFAAEVAGGSKLEADQRGGAIKGPVGRFIRAFGSRALLYADEVAKSMLYDMHVGAYAYRIAKDEGLKGPELQERITELINDPASEAQTMTLEKTLELTFQAEPGRTGKALQRASRALPGARWIVPFVRTPLNILKTGLRKSPLGLLGLAGRMATGKLEGRGVQLAAEQIIAWSMMSLIYGMSNGEDDEGRPYITGSVSSRDPAEREMSRRGIQPHSILIGGTYFSYRNIEPFATMLAPMVDVARLIHSSERGIDASRLTEKLYAMSVGMALDKSWTSGISDMVQAMEDPGKALNWGTRFGSSFMPNIVRVGARGTDKYWRDTSVKGQGLSWMADFAKKTGYRALPYKDLPITPPVAVDVWGRDVKKYSQGNAASDFLASLFMPTELMDVDIHPGDQFLIRYNNRFPNEQWRPALPSASFSAGGVSYTMNDTQYREFLKIRGQMADAAFRRMANTPDPSGTGMLIDPERPSIQQRERLAGIFSTAQTAAKAEIFRRYFDPGHLERVEDRRIQRETRTPN